MTCRSFFRSPVPTKTRKNTAYCQVSVVECVESGLKRNKKKRLHQRHIQRLGSGSNSLYEGLDRLSNRYKFVARSVFFFRFDAIVLVIFYLFLFSLGD